MAIILPPEVEKQALVEAEREGIDIDTFVATALAEKLNRTVHSEVEASVPQPNIGMLEALREISERQKGRRATSGEETQRMLREARARGMYGLTPSDE